MNYNEPQVPRCPVCGADPDDSRVGDSQTSGDQEDSFECCPHLVPVKQGYNVAEELASFCGGIRSWFQARKKVSCSLRLEWAEAAERGDESKDQEGAYFVKQFIETCPALARVDYYYHAVGGVGTASVVAHPFVWASDKAKLADQMRKQLRLAAKGENSDRSDTT